MENECEALPGVAYPGVWDNRSTINTKTGYDDMMMIFAYCMQTVSRSEKQKKNSITPKLTDNKCTTTVVHRVTDLPFINIFIDDYIYRRIPFRFAD